MIPVFLRFYQGYNMRSLMEEYMVTFLALCNEMFKQQATELLNVTATNHPPEGFIEALSEKAQGNDRILREIENIRKVRDV